MPEDIDTLTEKLLDLLDAPLVDRDPMLDQRVLYDPSADRAKRQARWAKQIEQSGVDVECEVCGKMMRLHPATAANAHACSQACRDKAYRQRQRDGAKRALMARPHQPWKQRRTA